MKLFTKKNFSAIPIELASVTKEYIILISKPEKAAEHAYSYRSSLANTGKILLETTTKTTSGFKEEHTVRN